MITAALEWIGTHYPSGFCGFKQTTVQQQIIKIMREHLRFLKRASTPLAVFFITTCPNSRRIGHFLNKKSTAGLLYILPYHIETESPFYTFCANRIIDNIAAG